MPTHARPALFSLLVAMLTALPLAASTSAQVVFVDASAPGAGTGATWEDAYIDLQDALGATSSGEI